MMKFLNQFSVATRQWALLTISAVVVSVCVAVGLFAIERLGQSSQEAFVAKDVVADILPPPMYLIELRLVLSQGIEGTLEPEQAIAEVQRLRKEYEERVAWWSAHPPAALASDLLGRQHADGQRLMVLAQTLTETLRDQGQDAARALLPQVDQLYRAHRAAVDVTVKLGLDHADLAMAAFDRTAEQGWRVQSLVLVTGLIGLGLLSWLIARSVVQPLRHAVEVAQAVARGDLTRQIQVDGRDEPARLLQSLNRMCASLADTVGQARSSSLNLAAAVHQLAAGNDDLKSRTVVHQSELDLTAASMRAGLESVQENAVSAEDARTLVQAISAAALQGSSAVGALSSTMDGISTSSQRVGSIVGVIEGIAFQTNLLALNAAVEAARAGEQGRGFAVVAGEVRQLAKRSSEAAREIRDLAAASTSDVGRGNEMAREASVAFDDMVRQVDQMSQRIGSIWESTFAQISGINMASESMAVLSSSAESNVALVTQTAGLAAMLRDDARRLADVVERFRLPASVA
ncbi:methyl-accepting chemotaxis protein [Sphaerotilus hippei]|uniref:Methyl-accepting chemotaxis protein n=1 Tax=Sphaerotilus hippei TaxID=744406 RepID=A0A318H0Q2_9BURK|nr:methyl-accepting chemotaxis protein [Sphaerotilus hippei]PXW96270.1 methyl-accepting chemotaxis protein [Sphaerotilus hippei]